jgi:ubiquitin conjugation factor E4 B
MLSQVVLTLLNCAETKEVAEAMGGSGYYNEQVFQKAGQLVLQWGMMAEPQARTFARFNEQCGKAQRDARAAAQDLGEAPEEFLDPITSEVMLDPVMLPASRNIVDRDVIVRHLLNEKNVRARGRERRRN